MLDEQHRFISDASHELRTPLTSLKSALEVTLREKNLSASEAKSTMKESLTDVNKLQSLTDALLQLAQYQSPATGAQYTSVDLSQAIASATRNVSGVSKQKHISIDYTPSHISIEADSYGVTDAVTILLDNAIKYSPNGSVVRIATERTDGAAIIKVIDHGQGIAVKDVPHIFDRFYRADIARAKHGTGGYGLGLSIAKQIVTLHGGTITVESTWHKGSIFTVRLPVKHTHAVLS
jgi:signal transduction histidine kinase